LRKKLTVFDYDNYREFLSAAYRDLKARNRNFSFRYFSRVAGFKSSSVLKGVMDGESKIAPQSIDRFARALKLTREETLYFRHLVLMNQSKSLEERHVHAEELVKMRKLRALHPLAVSQFNYYNRWYSVPVRELVGTVGFREDPEWIAQQISPPISALDASLALADLMKLGLVRRDESGKLRQAEMNVSTGDEVISSAISHWHREMLKKAGESIERHAKPERDISAVTVSVSSDTMSRVKQMIQDFRKSILEECTKDPAPERVYQLGIQFFPLSKASKSKPGGG
jgi:uncharacterized protein (TIGR02147 family)